MSAFFDYIQPFYVNPDRVSGSPTVMVTSAIVYFKAKPSTVQNISGLSNPGITAWLCVVENDQPIPERTVKNSVVYIPYERINTSDNAMTGTVISFNTPAILPTGAYYGLVIKYDDPAFDIWVNKQGDALVDNNGVTNTPSSGSQSRFDGNLYKATNTNELKSLSDRDLKFQINIAEFSGNSQSFTLVNKDYEFLTVANSSGAFIGGEYVYKNSASETGQITVSSASANIVGVGTDFTTITEDMYIVVSNGTVTDTIQINKIANSSFITLEKFPSFSGTFDFKVPVVGKVYYSDASKNLLYLVDSTAANSAFRLSAGDTVVGERSRTTATIASVDYYTVDTFTPKFTIGNPSTSDYNVSYKLSTSANTLYTEQTSLQLAAVNDTSYDARILSRSVEVDSTESSSLYGDRRKSATSTINLNIVSGSYSVPYVDASEVDLFVYQNYVSANTATTRYGISDFDSEIEKNGLAQSKHISNKVTFNADKFAEDVLVYMTAYRPAGTDIKIYAKIHNSSDKESFDDKAWSPLEIKNNTELYSTDKNDLVEYTYGLKQYPDVLSTLSGTFITQVSNSVITTSTDQSAIISAGDLIKVYDPLVVSNHEVFIALSSNTTAIVVNKTITNTNILGSISIDKLKYKNVAWNNIASDNVCRYVNTSKVEFDTYNSMQVKVVFTSNNSNIVPEVDQIQVIGVSA